MNNSLEQDEDCSEWRLEGESNPIKNVCRAVVQKIADDITEGNQYLVQIVGVLLLANKNLHNNDAVSRAIKKYTTSKDYMCDTQWSTTYPSQVENTLWTIFTRREIQGCLPLSNISNVTLAEYFRDLVKCEDPSIGLMLFLFPEVATCERIDIAECIAYKNLGTWMLGDKMLIWLAVVNNPNATCSEEKVKEISELVCGLQLESGPYSTVAGKNQTGNLISSAIGLLVLASCIRQKEEDELVGRAALKLSNWIINRIIGEEDIDLLSMAWSLYALSEYACVNKMRTDICN